MKTRTLLRSTLVKKNACVGQVELFRDKFGDAVEVSEGLCKSMACMFNFDWAARHLLSDTAWKAYEEAKATAWKACGEGKATGWAWKDYEEATAPALKACGEARAAAFARLYIEEKKQYLDYPVWQAMGAGSKEE